MNFVTRKGINKAVVLLKIIEDGRLIVVDSETTIRFMKADELSLIDGFKVNVKHEYYKTNVVSFSNDGDYFATLTTDRKESCLYNTKTKKRIADVDRHQGEVSCVGIDPLNRYMFSCGDDGKTFAIDIKSGKLVFTLPIHVDTINDVAFSANGNWIATCSYDRKISVFSLVTMTAKRKLKAHAAAVTKMKFIKNNRLVSIDKNSSAIIWDMYTGKVIERLQGIHDDVRQIVTSKDDEFLFLGTALGYVLVYDLSTYELLSPKYIKIASPISALEFNEKNHQLIIGTEDGFIMSYNIYDGEEKLWENTLAKAKIALQSNDKAKALLLFNTFKNIPSKNKIINKTIADYAEFAKFAKFAKEGKLALAYSLCNTYPVYKDSKLYKALEERWKKTFMQAQKYVLDPKGIESAKEVLKPYRGISEKTKLIQELLTQGEVYKRFRTAIGQKDFTICFELIKQHQFLKEFPEYEILMNYADTLYIKSQELLGKGDTNSAIKMLRVLAVFDDFKEEVKILMHDIETKQKFFTAVENEEFDKAYDYMTQTEDLQDTPDGQKLQNKWYSDLAKANEFAVNGDALNIGKALSFYMRMRAKATAIATVFAWCYMVQLEDSARDGAPQLALEKGIKNYMLHFGPRQNSNWSSLLMVRSQCGDHQ
ncbi:WD-40 repeat protein [hydrothermal vent metagenome]|uniref:WD-40 repeat protein n=1 Tax=hydrothermal vent metagenome TaxID=652676 RepID=A0A1W1CP13_9ZZZZ